jgi:hypothetical protein
MEWPFSIIAKLNQLKCLKKSTFKLKYFHSLSAELQQLMLTFEFKQSLCKK